MDNSNPLPIRDIAFSCDNNGAKFLCVTVWSLLKHYRGKEPLRINVFEGYGGHSEESKSKLKAIVQEWNAKHHSSTSTRDFDFFSLRYHNVEKFVAPYADVIMNRAKSRWNIFTWTPIFTPEILADATGNVAHFDIDMLFNDDVSKILDLDLGENLIACVAEYNRPKKLSTDYTDLHGLRDLDKAGESVKSVKSVDLKEAAIWANGILPPTVERYFNTGTIVFNAEACRRERTWDRLVAWYKAHYDIADRIEQDAWNALYHDRTLLLPLRWNFHDRLVKSFAKWDMSEKYWLGNPPRESCEAALDPAILHFWGPKKPWKVCHRPYRKLYHVAMRAVGQVPPRPELFAWAQDLATWRRLRRIRSRLATLGPAEKDK